MRTTPRRDLVKQRSRRREYLTDLGGGEGKSGETEKVIKALTKRGRGAPPSQKGKERGYDYHSQSC